MITIIVCWTRTGCMRIHHPGTRLTRNQFAPPTSMRVIICGSLERKCMRAMHPLMSASHCIRVKTIDYQLAAAANGACPPVFIAPTDTLRPIGKPCPTTVVLICNEDITFTHPSPTSSAMGWSSCGHQPTAGAIIINPSNDCPDLLQIYICIYISSVHPQWTTRRKQFITVTKCDDDFCFAGLG